MTEVTEQPNEQLLRETVLWVEAEAAKAAAGERSRWQQADWVSWPDMDSAQEQAYEQDQTIPVTVEWNCGTTACFCGKLAIDQKADITVDPDGGVWFDGQDPLRYGTALLNIANSQAARLFAANNDASDIRRIAEDIVGHPL